ncbi:MAG: hypothetical protein WBN03_01355 [Desulfobacterales bacterium]
MKPIISPTTRVACVSCALLAIVCSTGSPSAASDKDPVKEAAHGLGISFLGNLSDHSISEASGIVASRRRADILWVINDSGNEPLIYAVGLDGSDYGHVPIRNARNQDWEDLAAFVYNRTAFLLIADCGDNENRRKSCVLYIAEEPRVGPVGIVEKAPLEWSYRIEYVYADGPRDCEGVAVDVQRREILLLTKRTEPPIIYSLPLTLTQSDKVQTARPVTRVGGIPKPTAEDLREDPLYGRFSSQPTAMDLSPDGALIAILTYKQTFLFDRKLNESWSQVFGRAPVPLVIPRMRQAEALCFSSDGGSLLMTSEKLPAPLYRLDIKP